MDPSFLILLAFFGVMYLLLIRPQQKRQKEHQAMVRSLEVGADIITIGGVHGTVAAVNEDSLDLTVSADGTVLRFQKSAVAKVVSDEDAVGDTGEGFTGEDATDDEGSGSAG